MRRWTGLMLLLLATGCGPQQASVRGKVTYKGELVKVGHIAFQPAEGQGLPSGADIFDGEYQVRELPPGRKRVLIKSKPTPRRVPESAIEREHVEAVAPKDPIPASAEGNNRIIELQSGEQVMDFPLLPAPAKR